MDMQGLPHSVEEPIRDYDTPTLSWRPPPAKGEDLGEGGDKGGIGKLSKADQAFWEEHAYNRAELDFITNLLLKEAFPNEPAPPSDDPAAVRKACEAAFSDAVKMPAEGEWAPDPDWKKGVFWGPDPPLDEDGNKMDLAAEIAACEAQLRAWRIKPGPDGFGLAPFEEQGEAIAVALREANGGVDPPPLPDDWQEAPTKMEWRALAKTYAQRRRRGEPPEDLNVIAAALRHSGVAAARKVVDDVEKQLAAAAAAATGAA